MLWSMNSGQTREVSRNNIPSTLDVRSPINDTEIKLVLLGVYFEHLRHEDPGNIFRIFLATLRKVLAAVVYGQDNRRCAMCRCQDIEQWHFPDGGAVSHSL